MLTSPRRLKKGPGRRPQSAKRQRFMELRARGWSVRAAEGSAVLVGHTVRAGGGVFDDIDQLRSGDEIEVEGSDGMLLYRVQSLDVLSKGELARNAEQIFTQAGPGRLVVITCDDWDGTGWRSNIVTVATPT